MPSISQLYSVSDSKEPNPWLVRNGYLYFGQNYGGNPSLQGYIKKLKLDDLTETTIFGPHDKWAMWQAVLDNKNNKLIFVGEANDDGGTLRAGITIVDLDNDTATLVLHPNTGDCNEFIGVALDYKNKRLIVGERPYGGITTGSNYPNGGGLWSIPLDTITDPSTWSRVYEDPDYAVWSSIAVFGDYVYASLFRNGTKSIVARAPLSDLTSWSIVETSNRNDRMTYVDADDKMIAYSIVDASGNVVVKWSNDGDNWNSITVASAPSVSGADIIRIIGKYILVFIQKPEATWSTDVYIIDTETNNVYSLGTIDGKIVGHGRGVFDGELIHYFGTQTDSAPSYIYKLVFDAKRTISLSISNPNPAPNETITLEATLLDENGNPVSGAEVEFYVLYFKQNGHCATGELIGSATTDSDGKASVSYTVPSDAEGKIVFRALYKG